MQTHLRVPIITITEKLHIKVGFRSVFLCCVPGFNHVHDNFWRWRGLHTSPYATFCTYEHVFNEIPKKSRGTLLFGVSVPKETSHDLKDLLMRLLQRNHQERISFGKPLSFSSRKTYERVCFQAWLLNLFLHSQKSFFTIRSWRQVRPQRNVGMLPRCVRSSCDSARALLLGS